MNEYFNSINNLVGWGDAPKEGIFFVGLEEAMPWKNNETSIKRIKELQAFTDRGLPGEPILSGQMKEELNKTTDRGERYTELPRIMSKIVIESGYDPAYAALHPDTYWLERLFQKGSHIFQANLYPLGKKRLKQVINSEAEKLFNITADEYRKFITKDTGRFNKIYEIKKKYDPKVTICFGKSGWQDFRRLFKLRPTSGNCNKMFEIYKFEKVILTPFFWNRHMDSSNIKELSKIIKLEFLCGK